MSVVKTDDTLPNSDIVGHTEQEEADVLVGGLEAPPPQGLNEDWT